MAGDTGPNGESAPRAPGGDGDRGLVEYPPGTAFPGVIGRTTDVSSPAWPRPSRAAPGSPNVVVIVLDDTGFG
ncbi:MAG TPA: hypothetical protein VE152_02225, partial [Acidimicrobiales bacterium]|nr:hypothetical protein [Acidimicrobiales bacterium]